MGNFSGKTDNQTETINWNNIETENMSSIPNFNKLSKETKKLISNLNIPSISENNTESALLDKLFYNKTHNLHKENIKYNSIKTNNDFSTTSPFLSSEMYNYFINSNIKSNIENKKIQYGGKNIRSR